MELSTVWEEEGDEGLLWGGEVLVCRGLRDGGAILHGTLDECCRSFVDVGGGGVVDDAIVVEVNGRTILWITTISHLNSTISTST